MKGNSEGQDRPCPGYLRNFGDQGLFWVECEGTAEWHPAGFWTCNHVSCGQDLGFDDFDTSNVGCPRISMKDERIMDLEEMLIEEKKESQAWREAWCDAIPGSGDPDDWYGKAHVVGNALKGLLRFMDMKTSASPPRRSARGGGSAARSDEDGQ